MRLKLRNLFRKRRRIEKLRPGTWIEFYKGNFVDRDYAQIQGFVIDIKNDWWVTLVEGPLGIPVNYRCDEISVVAVISGPLPPSHINRRCIVEEPPAHPVSRYEVE